MGFKPLGTCFNTSDCSDGYDCKPTDKSICSCDPATGTDSCKPLGSCVMQPCKACEQCVQAMQLFPSIVKDTSKRGVIASKFKDFCVGTGRSSLVCGATADAITYSTAGSLGRRVGALCQSLAECSAATVTCNITAVAGQDPQRVNLCTMEGVVGGTAVADVSGQAAPGSCHNNAGCPTPGTFCSLEAQTRVCSCDSGTGAVTCEMWGACQPTPCKVCSDCVADLQPYVTGIADNSTAPTVSAAFQVACTNKSYPQLLCGAAASFISTSNKGNLGRRAGALCSILGKWYVSCIAWGVANRFCVMNQQYLQ